MTLDAQLLETEMPDFKGNSKDLLKQLGFGPEYQAFRLRRNRIVHLRLDEPAITRRSAMERQSGDAGGGRIYNWSYAFSILLKPKRLKVPIPYYGSIFLQAAAQT